MELRSSTLFYLLLKALKPKLVCDVGSMDAYQAQRFRQVLPESRIVAFEANPNNVALMKQNEKLKQSRIELVHKAVSNRNGNMVFHVEDQTTDDRDAWRRGISSTRERLVGSIGDEKFEVPGTRLDTYVQGLEGTPETLALWIDVEGAGYEAIEGLQHIADRVEIIHVEVETKEIWAGQKTEPDVINLLGRMGFLQLARGLPLEAEHLQHDLVFISRRALADFPVRIRTMLVLAYLLSLVAKLSGNTFHRFAMFCWRRQPVKMDSGTPENSANRK